jgi:Ribbon-helix-helix protein, copG family
MRALALPCNLPYSGGMKYPQLTFRLDDDTARRLRALSIEHGLSRGELIRRAVRLGYGIPAPGQALSAALACNLDAQWLNGERADHG